MATKYQYNEEAHNTNYALYTPGNRWGAQTFEHGAQFSITYVELYMHKSGAGGNVIVSITEVDGSNHPVAEDKAVSPAVDCTGITDSGSEWVTFTFISPFTIEANTTYAIVAKGDTVIANAVRWEVDTTSPSYGNGNFVSSNDSGSSWTTQGWDGIFRVWGVSAVTYSELAGTIAATSGISGNMNITSIVTLAGTIAATSAVSGNLGSTTVDIEVETAFIKRLITAGSNRIYFEAI